MCCGQDSSLLPCAMVMLGGAWSGVSGWVLCVERLLFAGRGVCQLFLYICQCVYCCQCSSLLLGAVLIDRLYRGGFIALAGGIVFHDFVQNFQKNRCSVGGKVILCAGLLSLTLDCVGVCLGMVLIGMDSEGLVQVSFHCVGRLR